MVVGAAEAVGDCEPCAVLAGVLELLEQPAATEAKSNVAARTGTNVFLLVMYIPLFVFTDALYVVQFEL